jgi:transposase-like protein
MSYPDAAWERAMTVQEVVLKALSGELHWFQAADILGMSARTLRRWRERYEQHGYVGLVDKRRHRPSARRVAAPERPDHSAGWRTCHGRACSNACPTRQRVASLNARPTNCTLSGSPSAEKPHGTDSVGLPLKLKGLVWMLFLTIRFHPSAVRTPKGSAAFGRAALAIDGHTRQSRPASIRFSRPVKAARTAAARA